MSKSLSSSPLLQSMGTLTGGKVSGSIPRRRFYLALPGLLLGIARSRTLELLKTWFILPKFLEYRCLSAAEVREYVKIV